LANLASPVEKGERMLKKNSHCSYCGTRFSEGPWPRQCRGCGNTSYLNPLLVVVALLPIAGGLVVVRRNIEPQKGTLTLPGGYVDLDETWQEGAVRELHEETGIDLSAEEITLYDVQNGLDNTIVIFGLAKQQPLERLKPFHSKETQEVTLIDRPVELGWSNHTRIVARYFAEQGSGMPEPPV
jgi:ADP-ribose pyrophosphatase YjhB (NUDIX family)